MVILRMGCGHPGTISQIHRRVPDPLRRHRQVHEVTGSYPSSEHHQGNSGSIPQVHCVPLRSPEPHHRGQRDPVQKQALSVVLRVY
jgi:hypothetical protein